MLSETKGLLDLVEACGRLSARGVPFRLEIMGQPESDKFIARLRARIVDLNLCRHVQFLGVLTGREKFAAFARSDVFCMPTFYERETFGIVFVEAMACGLPVVATRWRGVPSVVDDGRTGFLVEPRDVDGIANRLADLADNAQLRRQMGVAGRERFLREFSLPRHIARMRRVFLDVAGLAREAKEIESPDESLALATTDD
jgi:glycosyltransferase involved in cell wall biosynthesis